MTALLEVSGVTMRFGGLTALSSVDFSIQPGRIFGLIGPNGSGKTSMFNVITGFYRPQEGAVALEGERIVGSSPHAIARRGISRTFQTAALQPERTVLENVLLGAYCGRKDLWRDFLSSARTREDEARAEQALARVGMLELKDQVTKNVPIGLRHTAELARALMSKPKLLMLDEAWAGLNTAEGLGLVKTVRRIRDEGVTVLLVEHNMKIVMQICDEMVVLDAGRKIAQGAPQAIRSDPRVIESYLGTSGEKRRAGEKA